MAAVIRIEINSSSAGSGFDDAKRGLRDLDKAARDSGGGFSSLKEIAIGALREVGAMAIQAAAAAGQALVGFAQQSVAAAGTFEESVNGLAAVAGSALDDAGFSLDDVSKKALQLGKDTQFSAQEAIQAMTELAKGGVPVASVMTDATDATLALAAAGDVALTKSAEIVAKTLGVWAANGVTAASATNAIAAAANASTLDVEGFAGAMFNAQGRAAAMKMPFEDFATTIAMISEGFKSGETAGVSYNNFLASLIPKSDKAAAAMRELGLVTADGTNRFFDATGAFIGNREAAQLLQDTFKDLNVEEALFYKNIIFGNDAMGAANMLIQKGAAGYDAAAAAMANAGTAADVAAFKQQGYAFAMEQFNGSIETLQIVIGSKLLPVLTPLITKFTELINVALAFAQGNYFIALTSLGSWLAENVNPALGSFIANLAIATDPLQTLKDGILTFLRDVAVALPGQLMAWAQAFMTWVLDAAPGMLANLATFVQGMIGAILAAAPGIITTITTWRNAFLQWLLDSMPGMGTNLALYVQSLLTLIGAHLPGIVAALATYAASFVQWIVNALPVFLTELGAFIASMLNYLLANAPAILSTLGEWTVQFVSWAVATGAKLIFEMGVLFGKFLAWFIEVAPRIQATMKAWEDATTRWILESWPGWMAELGKLWNKLKGWIGETAGKLAADGSIGRALIDGIRSGINAAVGSLISAARSAVERALSAARSAIGAGGGSGGGATGGFAMGGPIRGPRMAWVGEHGPELAMLPAGSGIVPATASAAIAQRTTNNYFNMSVSTNATASTVQADYQLMQALAGVA